jgi:hypothetical protein
MPEVTTGEWREVAAQAFAADERHPYSFRCVTYERIGE